MRARTPLAVLALASLAALSATGCRRSSAKAPPAAAWYDATPLLVSLRPAARTGLEAASGVAHLEDLPLYDLTVTVADPAPTFTLAEDVWFTNREAAPLDEVVLRLYANSSEGGTGGKKTSLVTLSKGSCVDAICTVKTEGSSTLSIKPSTAIAPGGRLRIHLDFTGTFETIDSGRTNVFAQGLESVSMLGGGEGAGDYGLLARGDGIRSMANFYAVVARRRDGKWERTDASAVGDLGSDELSHVRARVDVPEPMRVVTSGVTVADKVAGARRVVDVRAAMVRDFAVISSADLRSSSQKVGDVEVRSWYLDTPEHPESKPGAKVLDAAAWALTDYEKRFGAYPYADLDVVEAPLVGGAGGVEFAGLVTIASMFYRPAMPTDGLGGLLSMLMPAAPGGGSPMDAMMGSMLEFVTAHEVAHQFWHGLVGSDSRAHPYLDEGLAQYTAIMYLEDRYGILRAESDGLLNVGMNYKTMRMLGHPDGKVDQPADAFGGMLRYAGLVYGKGPYLWQAIRKELGDAGFTKGVQAYVAANRLRVAAPRALVDALAAVDPSKSTRVRALATRWLDEAHGDDDLGKGSLIDLLGPAMGLDPKSIDPAMKSLLDGLLDGAGSGKKGGSGDPLGGLLDGLLDDGD
ncbi:MAG: hypothetical protein NVSMB47_05530 [Polyangiales bacterium]